MLARVVTLAASAISLVAFTSTAIATAHGDQLTRRATTGAYVVGRIRDVSKGCPGGTGDVAEATDPRRGYVYVSFEGCDHDNGIGFVRSINGGRRYSVPVALPASRGAWDPWLAVAPDGTLYASFMKTTSARTYPTIEVSHNQGRTFKVENSLRPRREHNWGDASYIAVGPNGTLYVAWGYGPSNSEVKNACSPTGSCYATAGDVNVVVQSSTNEGRSFSPRTVVSPGYPDSGADEGDVTVGPNGQVDVLYQDYEVLSRKTLRLARGHEYFTSSSDGGKTWTASVEVGASAGKMTINEWWDDGSIAVDPSGDLYATWDTQGRSGARRTDIPWVSFSTDGGQAWSTPIQVSPDRAPVPHITQVIGAGPGGAYVGWLSDSNRRGYAQYLRTFSVAANGGAGGWLTPAQRISTRFGNPKDGPCDTFGIATLAPTKLVLSWGSALPSSGGNPSVFAARVRARTG